jgi:uncharacterized protein (TIRG00374 family)
MAWYVGPHRLLDALRQADPRILFGAVCLTPISLAVKITRWWVLARSVDAHIRWRDAAGSYLAGLCLAVITPFASGELARGLWFQQRAELTGKVLVDKLLDLTVVALFTVTGIIWIPGYVPLKIVCAVMAVVMAGAWSVRRWLGALGMRIGEKLRRPALVRLCEAVRHIETRVLGTIVLLAALFFVLFYAQAFVLLKGFAPSAPARTLTVFPLITLSTIVPITIGGLGIREWAAALLLRHFEISDAVAVNAFFMHFIVITFIPGLLGAPLVQRLTRLNAATDAASLSHATPASTTAQHQA